MSFSVTDCSLVIFFTHFLIINVIVIKRVSVIHIVIDTDIAIIIALISSSLSTAHIVIVIVNVIIAIVVVIVIVQISRIKVQDFQKSKFAQTFQPALLTKTTSIIP